MTGDILVNGGDDSTVLFDAVQLPRPMEVVEEILGHAGYAEPLWACEHIGGSDGATGSYGGPALFEDFGICADCTWAPTTDIFNYLPKPTGGAS